MLEGYVENMFLSTFFFLITQLRILRDYFTFIDIS